MMKTVALALGLAIAATGCISDVTGDGTNPGPGSGSGSNTPDPPTVMTFVHQQDAAICAEAWTCQATAPDPTAFATMYGDTAAGCVAVVDTTMRIPSIEGSVTAGRILFNPTAATTCLAGTTAPATCDVFFATGMVQPSSCLDALKGTVADGDQCAVDYDCLNDDSLCNLDNTTCVAR